MEHSELINKAGIKTITTFEANEDTVTLWRLEQKQRNSNPKFWVLTCLRNGEKINGATQNFKRLNKDLKKWFGIEK